MISTGTLVYTSTGFINSEKINIGDQVLTHEGTFSKVDAISQREYNGLIYNLQIAHVSQPLLISGENLVRGVRTGACDIGYANYCRSECPWEKQNNGCSRQIYNRYALEWIPVEQIKQHDLIYVPTLRKTALPIAFDLRNELSESEYIEWGKTLHYQKATTTSLSRTTERQYKILTTLPLSLNLCWLVGYFAADGYARVEHDGGTIQFTSHVDELALQRITNELMQECFGIFSGKVTDNRLQNNNSVRLNFYSKPVAQLLRKWCYTESGHKKFPDWAVELPDKYAAELLHGYWSGDGSRNDKLYQATTNSMYLAGQLKLMLQRLGIVSRLHVRQVKPTKVNGKIVKATGSHYLIQVGGESLVQLANYVGLPKAGNVSIKRGSQHGQWWNRGYLLPVREIKLENYAGKIRRLNSIANSYTTIAGCIHGSTERVEK